MSKPNYQQAINNDIKHSMALLLHPNPTLQQEAERNTLLRTLTIPNSLINREIQILAWRYKTSLPIVKPVEYNIHHNPNSPSKNNNMPSSSSCNFFSSKTFQKQLPTQTDMQIYSPRDKETMCEIMIQIEDIKCRLSDLGLLPFSQILYLLKEMMIGYDVLIDKFGTFSPSQSMVAVSINSQWKMWINQDFFKNSKQDDKSIQIGQREFIYCLILLAEKHCTVTSQSKCFFNDIKEYTYSKNCGFVKILQKIKEFSIVNKIFQVNKVILPLERTQKSTKETNFNQTAYHSKNVSNNESFNSNRPESKLRMQKKLSFQYQISSLTPKYPANSAHMIKSSFQNFQHQNFKNQHYVPKMQSSHNLQLQQCRSQKVINNSSFFYNPLHQQPMPYCSPKNQSHNLINQPSMSFKIASNVNNQKNSMGYSYMQNYDQKKPENGYKSPQIRPKPQSPQTHNLQHKINSFMNFAKSRQEIKNLVSYKTEIPVNKLLKPPEQTRGKQRKYSQQIFKAKSVDALATVAKKIYGSNIYQQDPEIKQNGVNVIKLNSNINKFNFSPIKKTTNNIEDTNKQYSAGIKCADSSTPNNSSNSTQQLQNSRERGNNKVSNYEHLKANDLNRGRIRNNQSSCYGMGGYTEQQKRQKNMVVSCSFRNRDLDESSKSESQQKGERAVGNNWTKKISGLFSDDASIKHLKGSVKFKTAQEERFQKQYLKDVKLQMLQKFGRPVRHSIVDEEQDFGPQSKNPYKSMQLIQQAIDQGKSYVEKDQKQDELQEEIPAVRGRHQTMQAYYKKQDQKGVNIQHRECVSYQCSQNDSEQQFNFQSQSYVINRK